LAFACDLCLRVTEPTRGDNIIDLIFTNDPLFVSDCSISPPLIGSDHNTVHFNVALPASSVPLSTLMVMVMYYDIIILVPVIAIV